MILSGVVISFFLIRFYFQLQASSFNCYYGLRRASTFGNTFYKMQQTPELPKDSDILPFQLDKTYKQVSCLTTLFDVYSLLLFHCVHGEPACFSCNQVQKKKKKQPKKQ